MQRSIAAAGATVALVTGLLLGVGSLVPASVAAVAPHHDYIATVIWPGAKLASDGKLHDAYLISRFTVTKGDAVTLTIYNYDGGPHTFTLRALGLNVQVPGSKKTGAPSTTTVTFTAKKAGSFVWQCMDPCDGQNKDWAMTHLGYMKGTFVVRP